MKSAGVPETSLVNREHHSGLDRDHPVRSVTTAEAETVNRSVPAHYR